MREHRRAAICISTFYGIQYPELSEFSDKIYKEIQFELLPMTFNNYYFRVFELFEIEFELPEQIF